MARLPRYQESGLISADIPRMDFANIREATAYSQTITSSLDKLSQFAFGKAREVQEQQNQILGIQMRGDLEAEVQKRFAELTFAVQTGQLTDFNQIQEEVRALSGMANGLARVSPQQANGLMTSIQAGGKALLAKSADILAKAYASQADQNTDSALSDLAVNLETMYEVADSAETMAQYEAGARGIAFSVAANNPDTLQAKMGDFEKVRVAARNNAVGKFIASPEFATTPSERLAKIRAGDMGRYSDVWKSIPQPEKDKIVDGINKRLADEATLIERESKLTEAVNTQQTMQDYDEFYLGRIGGDELIRRMATRNYFPGREELKAIRQGDVPGAPDQYMGALEWQARQGTMTADQAHNLFVQGRISLKQRNSLWAVVDKTDRPDLARGKEYIANAFVPNPFDPMTRQGNMRKAEVTNQLLVEEQKARAEGLPFDAFKRAQELVTSRMGAEDMKALQDTRERLRRKLEENKITYREDLTVNDLKEAGVNANEIKIINRLLRTIESLK